jgi:hypothetical protein
MLMNMGGQVRSRNSPKDLTLRIIGKKHLYTAHHREGSAPHSPLMLWISSLTWWD